MKLSLDNKYGINEIENREPGKKKKKINKTKSSFFQMVNKIETSGKTNLEEEHWIDLVLFKETEFVAKSLLKKKPPGPANFPCEFYYAFEEITQSTSQFIS